MREANTREWKHRIVTKQSHRRIGIPTSSKGKLLITPYLGAGEAGVNVLGALGGGGDEGEVDGGGGDAGELDLGLLSSLGEALEGLCI